MTEHHDALETRAPEAREADLFARLPAVLAAAMQAPAYARRLAGIDPAAITDRNALSTLPVLRKAELPALQKEAWPFGGFVPTAPGGFGRLFTSPGPIFEPEGTGADPWGAARGLFAAGFRPGDIVLNTFGYHLTPGGFIMDSGARALGCAVIPAGPGNTEQQMEVIAAYRPTAYAGTPDFLKILVEAAESRGVDISSIKRAVVSGAAFPPSLQAWVRERGIDAYQLYATADVGIIAYETSAREGMVLNENLIVEIVRPGTGNPVAEGEVGEIVVTNLDPHHPQIRLAVGDLTALMPGASAWLDGPRRPDGEDQGHVRAARADRRDRAPPQRGAQAAPRCRPRQRGRHDDAEGGDLRPAGRADRCDVLDPAAGDQAQGLGRDPAAGLAAE